MAHRPRAATQNQDDQRSSGHLPALLAPTPVHDRYPSCPKRPFTPARPPHQVMNSYSIVEMHGDGISKELSESVHTLAEALPFDITLDPVDISLESRTARGEAIYDQVMDKMNEHKRKAIAKTLLSLSASESSVRKGPAQAVRAPHSSHYVASQFTHHGFTHFPEILPPQQTKTREGNTILPEISILTPITLHVGSQTRTVLVQVERKA